MIDGALAIGVSMTMAFFAWIGYEFWRYRYLKGKEHSE